MVLLAAQNDRACHFLTMSNEILLAINAHLESPWQASFALTCKHLKETIWSQDLLLRLGENDLAIFLSAWSRNIPGKYFCFCCNKIRPLNPRHGWDGHDHEGTVGAFRNLNWKDHGTLLGCIVDFTDAYRTFMKMHDIQFMKAYLVMSRHRYGPNHGIPLDSLEYSAALDQERVIGGSVNTGFRTMFGPRNEMFNSTMGLRPREEKHWRLSI
ncbi:hypothetical protein HDV57DRAFT_315014 [Trichoderma longibrachiatum]|uniref:F-box domain-containing protein n=1 Tax=Trichoderma longibrachiatum ATCC 18648 TaxID=983965 RepID=A0A2T4BP57_TRILO|nr:hypothetical protein M440DRAFT_223552 [Trichoderma longibrachiatum ATCC 18648]